MAPRRAKSACCSDRGRIRFRHPSSAAAPGLLPRELAAELLIGVTLSMTMIPLFAVFAARVRAVPGLP